MGWDKSFFNDTMHELVSRWQKCVSASGEYFEGEQVVIDPLFTKDNGEESEASEGSEETDDNH